VVQISFSGYPQASNSNMAAKDFTNDTPRVDYIRSYLTYLASAVRYTFTQLELRNQSRYASLDVQILSCPCHQFEFLIGRELMGAVTSCGLCSMSSSGRPDTR
jgi:hypothetical protein